MTDIVKGMARAFWAKHTGTSPAHIAVEPVDDEAMRAALLFLADNVSDEMVRHILFQLPDTAFGGDIRRALSSAIRAAAGGAE
jgi:hypothetical protein